MNIQLITKIAFEQLGNEKHMPTREKGYLFYHGQRVARLSLNLKQKLDAKNQINDDILYAGALFHDVGKEEEPHNEVGAQRVRELLKEHVTSAELDEIALIVRGHNMRKKANKYSIAVRIVQDADILDHMGAMNIWLAFHWNAHHEESVEKSLGFYNSAESKEYCARLGKILNFDVSRNIWQERVKFEEQFYNEFAREINGQ